MSFCPGGARRHRSWHLALIVPSISERGREREKGQRENRERTRRQTVSHPSAPCESGRLCTCARFASAKWIIYSWPDWLCATQLRYRKSGSKQASLLHYRRPDVPIHWLFRSHPQTYPLWRFNQRKSITLTITNFLMISWKSNYRIASPVTLVVFFNAK